MIRFTGDLVELRPHAKENLETYMRWFGDPEVLSNSNPGAAMPVTWEEEQRWYERMTSADAKSHPFAIHERDGGRLVGTCDLHDVNSRNRSAILGMNIGEPDARGRGLGTDATRVLVGYGFGELNLNRIQLNVFGFNERAIRAYTKAGFTVEARRREAIWRDGRYHDVVIMGVLAADWRTS